MLQQVLTHTHLQLNFSDLIYFSLLDKEALAKPHQETDECFHGVFSHREEEDCWAESRHSQRRNLQTTGEEVCVICLLNGGGDRWWQDINKETYLRKYQWSAVGCSCQQSGVTGWINLCEKSKYVLGMSPHSSRHWVLWPVNTEGELWLPIIKDPGLVVVFVSFYDDITLWLSLAVIPWSGIII